jgi:hypothetical protein
LFEAAARMDATTGTPECGHPRPRLWFVPNDDNGAA